MSRQARGSPAPPDAAGSAARSPLPGKSAHAGLPPRRRRGMAFVLIAAVAVLGAAIASVLLAVPTHHPKPRVGKVLVTPSTHADYHVAPGATGDCARAPCGSLSAAVQKAKAATTAGAAGATAVVAVAAGNYPQQTIEKGKNPAAAVVVEAERGAAVRLDGLTIEAAHVTVRGVTVNGPAKVDSSATGSGLDDVTTDKGSVFLAASGAFLTNSRVQPPPDADGVQIKAYGGKNPQGVTIDHTVIGPTHRGPRKVHVDCIQILGGSDIAIRHSQLFHCADQGIIAGAGASGKITGTIEVSYTQVQLCPQRTSDCDGYDAIEMKAPSVMFTHNTVIDGAAVFRVDDLTVKSSYFDNLKTCSGTFEDNLVDRTGCDKLPASNRRGQLHFANRGAEPPDLTPTKAVTLSGAWVGALPPAPSNAGGGA